ncbi:MAG TPA: 16S rRNA (guanine(966)-N(2))-methyltransferase RsmD [Sandaracinaceae bacterium]
MRIVGGRFGGRRLAAPRGEGTRPTAERVREAIASALEARGWIEGAVVLDLFAGTGALGLEALSRGAARAVFVDRDPARARAIEKAARELGIGDDVRALALDLEKPPRAWLGRLPGDEVFDLVFVDPPYAMIAAVTKVLAALAKSGKLRPGAAVVVEHARRHPPELPPGFAEIARYRYGDTAVLLSTAPGRMGADT